MDNKETIRSKPQDNCVFCGTKGSQIYEKLTDNLFNIAKGEWNLYQCQNKDCELTWLNPMPLAEDIGKAYKSYYTHTDGFIKKQSVIRELYENAKKGYLASLYDYQNNIAIFYKLLGNIFYLLPVKKQMLDYPFKLLKHLPKGKLLEIGCGSGKHLNLLQNWGWDVYGLDFDHEAVETAKTKKLNVICGDLLSQNYLENEFDVILMHHVIEHLPNPIEVIKECDRILKTDGSLIFLTPNMDSLGRKIYKENWLGIDSPRHLYLYNAYSLKMLSSVLSLNNVTIKTSTKGTVHFINSIKLRYADKFFFNSGLLLWCMEILIDNIIKSHISEEIVFIYRK